MKNRDVWDKYDFYTGEITKHSRFLGFAGLAICWFFKTPEVTFPTLILLGMVGLVLFFMLDLLQYYVGATRLRNWMTAEEDRREKDGSLDGDYWLPKTLDRPGFVLFHAKLLALLIGFLFIGAELLNRI